MRYLAVYSVNGWEVIDSDYNNKIVHTATSRQDAIAQAEAFNNRDKLQQI